MKDSITHAEVQILDLISNDMVINCNLVIEYIARQFVTWTYGNECCNCIPIDTQYIPMAYDLTPAPFERKD